MGLRELALLQEQDRLTENNTPAPATPDRSLLGDMGVGLQRGLFGQGVAQLGGAMQAFAPVGSSVYEAGKELKSDAEMVGRLPELQQSGVKRGVVGDILIKGSEGVGQMAIPIAVGALTQNPYAAAAASGGIYGGSTYQETKEKALEKYGLNDEYAAANPDDPRVKVAKQVGLLSGTVQGVGDAAMTAAGGKLLKGAVPSLKAFGGALAPTAEKTLEGFVNPSTVKNFMKAWGVGMLGEGVTEAAQDELQAAIERYYGIPNTPKLGEQAWDSAKGGIGTALLLGPLGVKGHRDQTKAKMAIAQTLADNQADQNARLRAATIVAADISKTDKAAAANFINNVREAINNGTSINLADASVLAPVQARQQEMFTPEEQPAAPVTSMRDLAAAQDIIPQTSPEQQAIDQAWQGEADRVKQQEQEAYDMARGEVIPGRDETQQPATPMLLQPPPGSTAAESAAWESRQISEWEKANGTQWAGERKYSQQQKVNPAEVEARYNHLRKRTQSGSAGFMSMKGENLSLGDNASNLVEQYIAQGRHEDAARILDELDNAENHEQIHTATYSNGKYHNEFAQAAQNLMQSKSVPVWLQDGIKYLLSKKEYKSQMKDADTVAKVMADPASAVLAINELLAGHNFETQDRKGYAAFRADLLNKMGIADKAAKPFTGQSLTQEDKDYLQNQPPGVPEVQAASAPTSEKDQLIARRAELHNELQDNVNLTEDDVDAYNSELEDIRQKLVKINSENKYSLNDSLDKTELEKMLEGREQEVYDFALRQGKAVDTAGMVDEFIKSKVGEAQDMNFAQKVVAAVRSFARRSGLGSLKYSNSEILQMVKGEKPYASELSQQMHVDKHINAKGLSNFGRAVAIKPSGKRAEVVKLMKDLFNTEVVFVRGAGRKINGMYAEGRIFIDADSQGGNTRKLAMWIAGHEVFHKLVAQNPEAYQQFVQSVTPYMQDMPEYQKRLNEIAKAQVGKEYTAEDANEELLADLMGDMLLDDKFWQQLAVDNPSLAQRIMQVVNDILDSLAALFKGRPTPAVAKEFVADMDKVRSLYAKYVGEQAVGAGVDGEVKLSITKGERDERAKFTSRILEEARRADEGSVVSNASKELARVLGTEFYDRASATARATKANERSALRKWAKQNGLLQGPAIFNKEWSAQLNTEGKPIQGNEHDVVFNSDGTVTKRNRMPNNYHNSYAELFDRVSLFNWLFTPDAKLTLTGFQEVDNTLMPVFQQKDLGGEAARIGETQQFLKESFDNIEGEPNTFRLKNSDIIITDVFGENTRKVGDQIIPMDYVVFHGKRAEEFLNYKKAQKNTINEASDAEEFNKYFNEAAGVGVDGETKYSPAWHGSPHDHDKFTTEKIGTGEGAQAYGWGLYFAESKGVAEWYRDKLATGPYDTNQGNEFSRAIKAYPKEIQQFVDEFEEYADRTLSLQELAVEMQNVHYFNEHNQPQRVSKEIADFILKNTNRVEFNRGRLYKVELAPAEEDYLLWDKPLSEQSEKVREALENLASEYMPPPNKRYSVLSDRINGELVFRVVEKQLSSGKSDVLKTFRDSAEAHKYVEEVKRMDGSLDTGLKGGEFYKELAYKIYKEKSPTPANEDKAASEYLHSLGIRGIKYLDANSRSGKKEDYNYVIFNDADVEITEKYSITQIPTDDKQGRRIAYMDYMKEAMQGLGYDVAIRMNEMAYMQIELSDKDGVVFLANRYIGESKGKYYATLSEAVGLREKDKNGKKIATAKGAYQPFIRAELRALENIVDTAESSLTGYGSVAAWKAEFPQELKDLERANLLKLTFSGQKPTVSSDTKFNKTAQEADYGKYKWNSARPDIDPADLNTISPNAWDFPRPVSVPQGGRSGAVGQSANSMLGQGRGDGLPASESQRVETARLLGQVSDAEIDDALKFSFAGVNAKTADLKALEKAKGIIGSLKRGTPEFDKADRKAWKETGWTHAFPDGKPRFEISDDGAKMRESFNPDPQGNLLVDALDHEPIYNAYTDTPTLRYEKTGLTSDYNPSSDTIRAAGANKSTTIHELQHAIQERENFARGGEPDYTAKTTVEMYGKTADNIKDAIRLRKIMDKESVDLGQARRLHQERFGNYPESEAALFAKDRNYDLEDEYQKTLQRINELTDTAIDPIGQYKALAGESEARLTQTRMDLTPEQRRDRYPLDDFDVPVGRQIVRMFSDKDGNKMSLAELNYRYSLSDTITPKVAKEWLGVQGKSFMATVNTIISKLQPLDRRYEYLRGMPWLPQDIRDMISQMEELSQLQARTQDGYMTRGKQLTDVWMDAAKKHKQLDAAFEVANYASRMQLDPRKSKSEQGWEPDVWRGQLGYKVNMTFDQAYEELMRQYKALNPEVRTAYSAVVAMVAEIRDDLKAAYMGHIDSLPIEDEKKAKIKKLAELRMRNLRGAYMPLSRFGQWDIAVYRLNDDGSLGEKVNADSSESRGEQMKKAEMLKAIYPSDQFVIKQIDNRSVLRAERNKISEAMLAKMKAMLIDNTNDVAFKKVKAEAKALLSDYAEDLDDDQRDILKAISVAGSHRTQAQALEKLKWDTDAKQEYREVMAALEETRRTATDNKLLNDTLDGLEQIFLETLPESSALKNSMHRRGVGVAGFNKDAIRSTLKYVQRNSRSIAYMKYGSALEKLESKAMKYARDMEDGDRSMKTQQHLNDTFTNRKLTQEEKVSDFARNVNKLGFFWFLTSPSMYVVQNAQPWTISLPYLMAKYGEGKAVSALYKHHVAQQISGKYSDSKIAMFDSDASRAPADWSSAIPFSLAHWYDSKATPEQREKLLAKLTPEERDLLALKLAIDSGMVANSLTHEGMDYILSGPKSELGVFFKNAGEKLSYLQQLSEFQSRKGVFMAAFDLARKEGKSFDLSLKDGLGAVKETLYDYSGANRPRVISGSVGRILGQFQMFRFQTLSMMVNLGLKAAAGDAQARKQVGYMLMANFMAAGVTGLPFAGTVGIALAAIGFMAGDDDWLREIEEEMLKTKAGQVAFKGMPMLLGLDLSRRIGLGDLSKAFQGEPPAKATVQDRANWYAGKILGPSYSAASTSVSAMYGGFMDGDWGKAIATGTPRPISSVLQAYQLQDKGLTNSDGRVVIPKDKINMYDVALMSVGVNPADVSITREKEKNIREVTAEQDIKRGKLAKALERAVIAQDVEAIQRASTEIARHNQRYPMFAFTSQDLATRVRGALKDQAGVTDKKYQKASMYLGR